MFGYITILFLFNFNANVKGEDMSGKETSSFLSVASFKEGSNVRSNPYYREHASGWGVMLRFINITGVISIPSSQGCTCKDPGTS